jgi:hypothetical protein
MAVAIKIEDQRLHVQWWDRTVRPAGGDQKGENHFRRDAEMIPMVDAEAATGISYQIVSRWSKGERRLSTTAVPAGGDDALIGSDPESEGRIALNRRASRSATMTASRDSAAQRVDRDLAHETTFASADRAFLNGVDLQQRP